MFLCCPFVFGCFRGFLLPVLMLAICKKFMQLAPPCAWLRELQRCRTGTRLLLPAVTTMASWFFCIASVPERVPCVLASTQVHIREQMDIDSDTAVRIFVLDTLAECTLRGLLGCHPSVPPLSVFVDLRAALGHVGSNARNKRAVVGD